jgi:adenosine deaminase
MPDPEPAKETAGGAGLHAFIAALPKVEIHVHLEGSIRPATLLALAERNGIALPATDVAGLHEFYRFTDFDHFIRVYFAISGCLKTVDDFALIAYEFGADMARQNVRYAEVTFTPQTNVANTGLPFEAILEGLNDGRTRARASFGVEMAWILDIVRDAPETRHAVASWAAGARDRGVVGLGLGGPERGNPPEPYADAFAFARAAGLHSVPHAGEVAGPESVWGALRVLKAERLGHGVRSAEDPSLLDYLREHQVPLEVCPTSEVRLGVYPSYAAHPMRRLWDKGLYLTVNSDDPPMFDTDLVAEYGVLATHLGFSAPELEQLSLNAVQASFLPEPRKQEMAETFRSEFRRLRAQHLGDVAGQP